ncbi:MAG: outer membrane lipoprotein carrier protein LolA [Candidatus Aminicenantes bacterium]|nr:outer membrane lipoprotein carrier protein LolA [Candidatus Aminicenantes bacterium]
MEKKIRSLSSLRSEFTHLYYDAAVSDPLREKGMFYFRKPDSLKWEYRDPETKIWIYEKGEYKYYIPEDNQLYRGSLQEDAKEAEVLLLLTGRRSILDDYSVSFDSFTTDRKDVSQIKLTPNEEGEYSSISLEILKEIQLISKIIFTDWAGNKSIFHFDKIRTGIRFKKNEFELKVPPDVEIIDNRPGPDKQTTS